MILLIKQLHPVALNKLIENLKVDKVFIITNHLYEYDLSIYPELEVEYITDIYSLIETVSNKNLISKLPIIDEEVLRKYQNIEQEFYFNSERVKQTYRVSRKVKESNYDESIYDYEFSKYIYRSGRQSFLERNQQYKLQLAYWDGFFSMNKIDLFVSKEIPHLPFHTLAWRVAQSYGVKCVFPIHTSIPDHCMIAFDEKQFIDRYSKVLDIDTELIGVFKKEYIRVTESTGKDFIPYYEIENFKKKEVESKRKKKKERLRILFFFKKLKLSATFFKKVIDSYYFDSKSKEIHRNYEILFEKISLDIDIEKIKYFYFPLHFQPEATSMPSGGYYADQLLIIDMVSKLLPPGVMLLVKEHPQQKGIYRNYDYYKRIAMMYDNVALVKKELSSLELIKNCISVVSITGTAAWEGFGKLKPALLFGFHPNILFKGAYRIRTKEDCKVAIQEIIHTTNLFNLEDFRLFINHIENNCVNFTNYPSIYNNISIEKLNENLADAIAEVYLSEIKYI